jgi:hypothetical protein
MKMDLSVYENQAEDFRFAPHSVAGRDGLWLVPYSTFA